MVSAAPGESTTPAANPDLSKACGLDVMMILDESGSIATSNATDDVQRAFTAFVESLNNTGSSMSVIEFSTVARLPSIGGVAPGTYLTIDNSTVPDFQEYIDDDYDPANKTNWEDALRVGRYMAPRPDPNIPHLVVFITDGDPTAVIRNSQVTPFEYENKVPLNSDEVSDAAGNAGATPAISNANALKADGSHILAIGVGAALQNAQSRQRLISVSGTDVFSGTGTFDIATDDVYLEPNFAELEDALRDAAFQLCAPSVTIRKLYDATPDPDSLDDAIPGVGWEMTGTVLSVPAPGSLDWVLPNSAPAGIVATPTSATSVTDAGGFVTFQWTPTNPDGTSTFQVTEDTGGNPPDPPGGTYSNVPSETACSYRTPDIPDTPITVGVLDPDGGFTIDIPPEAIVTCRLVNVATPVPGIDIEKFTNGADADTGTGPIIAVGGGVTWEFLVTNTGNTTLTNVEVIDSDLGTIACPSTTIAFDDSMTCTATGTAVAGQYENTATVTATDTNGIDVDDIDPSHYFGAILGINVEKATNGQDADAPFGPGINVGGPVNWTYQVSLVPGNVPLEDVSLVDDGGTPLVPGDNFVPTFTGGDVGVLGVLEPGETWNYEATGIATAGPYENFATVIGDPVGANETIATDNDPSHYYGVASAISIEKYTNGADADLITDDDVPILRVGDTVDWIYVVTNEGNVPIPGWVVTDSDVGTVGCTRQVLTVGASAICHHSGTVVQGEYENIATVNATDIVGNTLTDTDPSHYIGVLPAIDIEKATNGADADAPPGPFLQFPSTVTWTYVVTNTGEVTLTDLVVVDPRLSGSTPLSCPTDTLAPGDSTTCTETGPALSGKYRNMAIAVATDPFGVQVSDFDPSHYFGVEGGITLKKYTNGVDADEAPGALIPVGDAVEWTYDVTNTGNSALSSIALSDNLLGAVTCPQTTLPVGGMMTCTATGTSIRGQYANTATVTGIDGAQQTVSDTDPSHYFGYILQIDIEKATNGEDADTPTGPYVPVGDAVTWTYVVTNPGDFHIGNVVVSDDRGVTPVFQGGDTNGDAFLDVGEVWTYEATGSSTADQYANTATVTGTAGDELDTVLTDSDPSHYFGLVASIDISKTPDVAVVDIGAPHTFEISVTNTSNVDLTDVVVTDPVVPACDREIGAMTPGQVVSYTCEVSEVFQHINNIASVTGVAPDGTVVTDEDPAEVTVIGEGGTCSIGNLVWLDNDGDGVQDAGEPGVAGARVTIALDTDSVEVIPLEIVTVTVTTDATGHYFVDGLVPGLYTVTLDLSSVSGTLTTAATYSLDLSPCDEVLDADFGVAQEAPGPVGGLPFTGVWAVTEMAILAGILILAGGAFLLRSRLRKPGTAELP